MEAVGIGEVNLPAHLEEQQVQIALNPAGVIVPFLNTMKITTDVVSIALSALDKTDLSGPVNIPGSFFQASFDAPHEKPEDRRNNYVAWLLSKGFQDIATGVRQSLEEALLYIEVLKLSGQRSSVEEFMATVEQLRRNANRQNFPDLLQSVNQGLSERLEFNEEFLSLQKVRNCLEHRAGLVGAQDATQDGALRLVLPRLKFFIERKGVEIEVKAYMHVEAGEAIVMRRDIKERLFKAGERVTFDANEFHEIALACWFFGADLEQKLPRPPERRKA